MRLHIVMLIVLFYCDCSVFAVLHWKNYRRLNLVLQRQHYTKLETSRLPLVVHYLLKLLSGLVQCREIVVVRRYRRRLFGQAL